MKAKFLSRVPARRFGNPADVAADVVFLASKKADFVTGATYSVNGGSTAML